MLDRRRTSVSGAVWPDLATLIEVGAIRHLHGDMAHAIYRRRTLAIPGAKSSRNHTVFGEIGPDVLEDLPRDRIPIAAGRLFAPVPFDDPRKPLRGRSQRRGTVYVHVRVLETVSRIQSFPQFHDYLIAMVPDEGNGTFTVLCESPESNPNSLLTFGSKSRSEHLFMELLPMGMCVRTATRILPIGTPRLLNPSTKSKTPVEPR